MTSSDPKDDADELGGCVGQDVVLDTRGELIYLGKLVRILAGFYELEDADVCCGFGGTFSVKYSDLSGAIVDKKTQKVEATGATTLLAGDLGCLMNMAGRLGRKGSTIEVRHVAEVLAGMADGPAIGKSSKGGRG